MKTTQKPAKRKTSTRFTEEERAAMKERLEELKAEARHGARGKKGGANGEREVLSKIAAMPEPDRAMATRLHAIVKASAPVLSCRQLFSTKTPVEASMVPPSRPRSRSDWIRPNGPSVARACRLSFPSEEPQMTGTAMTTLWRSYLRAHSPWRRVSFGSASRHAKGRHHISRCRPRVRLSVADRSPQSCALERFIS